MLAMNAEGKRADEYAMVIGFYKRCMRLLPGYAGLTRWNGEHVHRQSMKSVLSIFLWLFAKI